MRPLGKLPAPAPEMLRTRAPNGHSMDGRERATVLADYGHLDSGVAVLRDNGLFEIDAAAPSQVGAALLVDKTAAVLAQPGEVPVFQSTRVGAPDHDRGFQCPAGRVLEEHRRQGHISFA